MLEVEAALLVATGFALGLAHAVDPDHIVAVSTLLCKNPNLRKSLVSATAWGAGHSATLLVVGLLVLALRVTIPPSVVSIFELAAAVMLIVMGAWVLKPFLTGKHLQAEHKHVHSHTHMDSEGKVQSHVHIHEEGHGHLHRSVFTGFLQGLAGSATIMLVTLTTVDSAELGLVFILVFGIGLILGMVGIACIINSIMSFTASRLERAHEKIQAVTGTISIAFGVFLALQVLLGFQVI
jgi:ABC-type nickel/cobalt efflux system permease component RcnA